MTERPRWLIIIQHQDQDLYEAFRERFQGLGIVVRLDRRRAERRQSRTAERGVERREADRRRRRPAAWLYLSSAKTSSASQVVDLVARPGHNHGS